MLKNLYSKKGGMFGLDARITVVILGAISVIASYHIYGVSKEALVSTILFDGKGIVKAINSYEYDMNNELGTFATTDKLEIVKLISSAEVNWSGPYLSTVINGSDNSLLISPNLGSFYVFKAKDRGAADVTEDPFVSCVTGEACYLWMIYDDASFSTRITEIAQKLDAKLDSSDGFLTGKVQKWNADLMYQLEQIDF
ncbi:MAG: hypothetical protein GY793_05290 [Proteobacteria bacterium]|nr:hypothetical protein [Pseudomonadota bacterium]